MDRAQLLAEMGIDIWVRNSRKLTAPVDFGIDTVLDDTVNPDELASDSSKQAMLAGSSATQRHQTEMGVEATQVLDSTDSMDMVRAEVMACRSCELCDTRSHVVPGVGNSSAKWLFIGEAPGAEEDRQGEPFVGRAGQLLGNIFRALGVSKQDVYVSNVLKCHPPGNRDPKSKEIDTCRAFLYREIRMVQPDVVVALGDIAIRELLQNDMPIDKLRGKIYQLASTDIPCIVTYHPTDVLREPEQKKHVWNDLLLAKTLVSETSETIPSTASVN